MEGARDPRGVEAVTVEEIVRAYLVAGGYDGLYCPGECCCSVDHLFPCEQVSTECEPGYRLPCDCGEGCDFHIGPREDKP